MSIPRHWRLQNQRYSMVGEVCNECGSKLFPPRDICPECAKPAYEPFTFSGNGRVYSYSTVYQAPAGYEEILDSLRHKDSIGDMIFESFWWGPDCRVHAGPVNAVNIHKEGSVADVIIKLALALYVIFGEDVVAHDST